MIGAPLRYQHRIYNTAVVIHRGRVLGVVPKLYLPTYREFYEGEDSRMSQDITAIAGMSCAYSRSRHAS